MKKRLLALLLAVVMVAGMIPAIAAANPTPARVIHPDTTSRATYTFYVGENVVDTQIVKAGDTLNEPAAPTGAGKLFLGWVYEDGSNVTFGTVASVKEEEVKVIAKFDDVQYLLFMDKKEDGRVVGCKTIPKDGSVNTADVTFPVGTEQAVTGWVDADGRAVETVTYGQEIYVLYAVVEDGYWLHFDTNGGSYIAPQFFTDTPDEPTTNPTKPGYTFEGWYLDERCMEPADFSEITGTCTVYANWIAEGNVQYTVLHMQENANDDGYSTKDIETKSGATGAQTNATANRYDGFTAQPITQQTIKGDGSTIVKVYYEREEYEVKFYYWESKFFGGDWKEYTDFCIKAKYGAYIGDKWPTMSGSSTWSTNSKLTWGGNLQGPYQVNIETMPLGGASFYGPKTGDDSETAYYYVEILPDETGSETWNNVRYKLHHSDTSPGTDYTVTDEDKYPITGFTYVGLKANKVNGGKYAYNNAKFFYTRNTYHLQFISGGTPVRTEDVPFEADISNHKNYEPDTPPAGKDGYVFGGWYDNELGEGAAYDFTGKTMPAQNITLHAKWVAPVHTVTFWQDETAANPLKKIENILHGSTITEDQAPEATVGDGEEFYGWTLRVGTPFNFDTKITEDYNLYARVGSEKGYKLTYSVNGDETLVKDDYHYAKDTPAVVKNYTPEDEDTDKVFLGWDTSEESTTVVYKPGATIKMTDDTILYAVFGPKTGTVSLTYHSNFGTDATQTVDDIANNGLITVSDYDDLSKLPTREGYSFRGWSTTATGSVEYKANDSAVIDNVDAATANHLYAVWQIKTYSYTVEYYIDGTKNDTLTVTDSAPFGMVINSYPVKCPTGYKLEKTENFPLTIGTDELANVIKVYYVKDTFKLTIHYVYEDGTEAKPDYTADVAVNESYSVPSPTIDGYTANTTTVSGTMPSQDVTETVTYTKRTDLSYTVNYYWNETQVEVAVSKTVNDQTFNASVTESPIAVEGYTAVSSDSTNLTIGTGANVINFYYYKNVTLTANRGSKVYNGQPQTLTGYTSAPEGVTFENVTASGSGTNKGEYDVEFATDPVNKVSTDEKYIVAAANPGKLTITPLALTYVGESKTVTYNGQQQSITGITEKTGKTLPTGHTLSGLTYLAEGTNAGVYNGAFTGTAKIEDASGTDVTANYEIKTELGKLTIEKSEAEVIVKITGETRTETYNGSEWTVTGYTTDIGSKPITVALKPGSKAEAKGTNAGEYKMGLKETDFEATSDNYSNIKIEVVDGWLKINPITDEVTVTITGNNKTVKYNGAEQKVEGYTYKAEDTAGKAISNKQFTVALKSGHKAEATGTSIGTYPMNLKGSDFTVTSTNYSNITVKVNDGWLKIVSNAIHFDPNDIDGEPIAEKYLIVRNGTAPEETFEVVIKQLRGEQLSDGAATLSGKGGRKDFNGFEQLTFTAAGTYTYTIGETDHNTRYMRYDSSLYTLTIVVTEGRSGLAISDVYYTDDAGKVSRSFPITFNNTYSRSTTPVIIPSTPSQLNTDDHYAYVIGYPDGSVHPNGEITRAEVATIFFRLLRDDVRSANFTTYNAYTDVSADKWYNNPISTMSRLGIIKGYPDGTFRPNDPITRAEFAAIAARFDEHKAAKLASFTDIYGHWAISEISLAYENGWIKGYNDGTFRPNRNITRAEAMALINRVLNRAPEKPSDLLNNMNKWTDNMDTTKWYYLDVQEATNSHDYTRKTNNYEMWKKMRTDPNWAKYER